jgi:hypothetical protein
MDRLVGMAVFVAAIEEGNPVSAARREIRLQVSSEMPSRSPRARLPDTTDIDRVPLTFQTLAACKTYLQK